MPKLDRISRRKKQGVLMGNASTGFFEAHYEESGIKAIEKQMPSQCLRNILCACERRRCPGRTYTTSYYTRKLMEA